MLAVVPAIADQVCASLTPYFAASATTGAVLSPSVCSMEPG